jgi:hypothetical protein
MDKKEKKKRQDQAAQIGLSPGVSWSHGQFSTTKERIQFELIEKVKKKNINRTQKKIKSLFRYLKQFPVESSKCY